MGFVRAAYDGDAPEPPARGLPAPPDLGGRAAASMRALGQGVHREGVLPGDFLLIARDTEPAGGDRVVHRLRGGEDRMARLIALDATSARLRSWGAGEDGAPRAVEEAVARRVITRLLPVLAVLAGEPGVAGAQFRPDPEAPNIAEIADDALARVAQALGLAPDADLDAVVRAADQLRRAVAAAKSRLPAALDAIRATLTEID